MAEIDKKALPTKLLWVDLEMTGLRPETDIIQEVCAIVTDFDFNVVASYEAIVNHPSGQLEALMSENPWFTAHEENRRAFLELAGTGKPDAQVSRELAEFVRENFAAEPAILAGNSIHNDRNFIKHWWPEFDASLHYRMLDVSSWKVFMQGAYGLEYEKKEAHRAHDDILESIEELKYYVNWLANLQPARLPTSAAR